MATQFIQQPDGKWAIWSTVTDSLIGIDFTEEELVQEEGERAKKRAEEEVRSYLQNRRDGRWGPFSVEWGDAYETCLKEDNDPEFTEAVKAIGKG